MPSAEPVLQGLKHTDNSTTASDDQAFNKSNRPKIRFNPLSKASKRGIKLANIVTLILVLILISIFLNYDLSYSIKHTLTPNKLQCVYALGANTSLEGLGSIIMRNQLACFIASSHNLPIEFPSLDSNHGYDLSSFFSHCRGDLDPEQIPIDCQMRFQNLNFERCPRGDCRCKLRRLEQHLRSHENHCTTLGVWHDEGYNSEFTGCLGNFLRRYFGNDTKPKHDYDVIHYRYGDLQSNRRNGKVFRRQHLYSIIRTLCNLSDRPIVVLTQGNPKVPSCEKNGIILASDLSIQETFKIAQHAKSMAVGESTFAFLLTEIAKPQRIIVMEKAVPFYEWVKCEKWTVIGKRGMPFHFNSKRAMEKAALERSSLMFMGSGHPHENRNFSMEVPARKWKDNDLFENMMPKLINVR